MEFTLFYDGPLTSNATAKNKHKIRQKFHNQLTELWNQEPLNIVRHDILSHLSTQYGDFQFVSLIHSELHLTARINVSMLLPGSPAQIINRGGDIDNRLKTLLDALTMPDANQVPPEPPSSDEQPFFCLLEDDKLITHLSIDTDRLLITEIESDDVKLFIHVTMKAVAGTHFSKFLGN